MKIQINKNDIRFGSEKYCLILTKYLFRFDFYDKKENEYAFLLYVFPEYLNPIKNKNEIVFDKNKEKKSFRK